MSARSGVRFFGETPDQGPWRLRTVDEAMFAISEVSGAWTIQLRGTAGGAFRVEFSPTEAGWFERFVASAEMPA